MQSEKILSQAFIYYWHLEPDSSEGTIIRAYGLTHDNESCCLIIKQFTPYVYIKLQDIKGLVWDNSKAMTVISYIEAKFKIKMLAKHFVFKKPLYYANVDEQGNDKLSPYIFASFLNKETILELKFKLRALQDIPGLGKIKLEVLEAEADPILQLYCVRNIPSCGWVEFSGKKIKPEKQESRANHEYVVHWRSLNKYECDNIPYPTILSFDIEVNSSIITAMPKSENTEDEVFQISVVISSKRGEYKKYLLTLGKPDLTKLAGITVITYDTELLLLSGFSDLVKNSNANVMIGFNIFGFDENYMYERAGRNGMVSHSFLNQGFYKQGGCIKEIKWSSKAFKNQVHRYMEAEGRMYVDMLLVAKRDYGRFENYKLETVSQNILGESKRGLSHGGIFKCYRLGMKGGSVGARALSICGDYCVQDSMLVLKLFEKMDTWTGLVEMAKVCNVSPFSLYTMGQQIRVFSQIYKYCSENGFVVDSCGYKNKPDEKYHGAYVIDPIPGIYKNVVPFDFASLYPTAMMAHNIDFSSYAVDPKIPDDKCHVIEWDDHIGCVHDKSGKKIKKEKVICGHFRYRFKKEPRGVAPSILDNLISMRKSINLRIAELKKLPQTDDIKKLMASLDKRQLACKISANSIYGFMGVEKGYLPFMPGATSTTAVGRDSLVKVINYITNDYKGQVIYGDTDSNMVHFPHLTTSQDIWDYAVKVSNEISTRFPPPMKLAFENTIFAQYLILTKKRYMWIESNRDGKISDKIGKKGVAIARRDNMKFLRDLYTNIVDQAFKGINKNIVINHILERLEWCFCNYVAKEDFYISVAVGHIDDYKIKPLPFDPKKRAKRLKDLGCTEEEYNNVALPAQVILADKMRKRGKRVDVGSRIYYVIVKVPFEPKATLRQKIEDPEYQKQHGSILKFDYLYYLHRLINPIDEILEVVYGEKDFMKNQYKLRATKEKVNAHILRFFQNKIELIQ